MTEQELQDMADDLHIQVIETDIPASGSMIIDTGSTYAIGLDRGLTGNEKRAHLAHEMGHAVKGAVYRSTSPLRTRSRCEYRANKWMYEKLLPLSRLEDACMKDLSAPLSEIADDLDVPESVLRGAIRHYMTLGLMIVGLPRNSIPQQDRELAALRLHALGRRTMDA